MQSETNTQRPIFVRPPATINLPKGVLLRIERPLYGIPEAGLHWFRTYHNHHCKKLQLHAATHDTCFLFSQHGMSQDSISSQLPRGFTCLQTDDTATVGNAEFIKIEESFSSTFDCKKATHLSNGGKIQFNGANIHLNGEIYSIHQPDHINKMSTISYENVSKTEFI